MKEEYERNLSQIETKRDQENQKNKKSLEVTINSLQQELQEIQDQWFSTEQELQAQKQ